MRPRCKFRRIKRLGGCGRSGHYDRRTARVLRRSSPGSTAWMDGSNHRCDAVGRPSRMKASTSGCRTRPMTLSLTDMSTSNSGGAPRLARRVAKTTCGGGCCSASSCGQSGQPNERARHGISFSDGRCHTSKAAGVSEWGASGPADSCRSGDAWPGVRWRPGLLSNGILGSLGGQACQRGAGRPI